MTEKEQREKNELKRVQFKKAWEVASKKLEGVDEETFKLVKEAMEKAAPEVPDVYGDGFADGELVYDTYICPYCNEHYEVDYEEYDYCPNCGQAIDLVNAWATDEEIEEMRKDEENEI